MTDEKIVRDAIWAELGALSTRVEELLARAEAAEARCATLEAALRAARHELDQWVLADNREMAYRVERAEAIIDAALAAATPPAEKEGLYLDHEHKIVQFPPPAEKEGT